MERNIFSTYLIKCLLVISVLSQSQNIFAQLKSYQFKEVDSLQQTEKRPVLVFVHTDWCSYCQTMKHTTFKNDSLISLLNKYFYFISFNAEEKNNIVFNHQTFKYKPTGLNTGINELAEELATVDKKVSYPTLCFLDTSYNITFQYSSYINHSDLFGILLKLKN